MTPVKTALPSQHLTKPTAQAKALAQNSVDIKPSK